MKLYTIDNNSLAIKEVPFKKILAISFVSLIILFSFVGYFVIETQVQKVYIQAENHVKLTTSDSFSKERLIQEIKDMPFEYKTLIYAQCILESGNFKSAAFKENNNMFGIRPVKQRLTTAKGDNIGWAQYKNWKACLYDRLLYEARYMHGLNREQYKKYLDQVYSEGGGYSDKLEQIIKQNNIKQLFND